MTQTGSNVRKKGRSGRSDQGGQLTQRRTKNTAMISVHTLTRIMSQVRCERLSDLACRAAPPRIGAALGITCLPRFNPQHLGRLPTT
jgi:hypothetical protein